MTLDELCGQRVSLCIRFNDVSGFIMGRLSTDHCVGGDYVIESDHCQSRVVFNKSTVDHINDSDPRAVLIFIGLSDKEIDDSNERSSQVRS